MADPTLADVVRVPCRLYHTPTDLSTVAGLGTSLGLLYAGAASRVAAYDEVRAAEYGGERVEGVRGGEDWSLVGILRAYDDEVLRRVMPRTATGGVSGHRVVSSPPVVASPLMAASGLVIVLTPLDQTADAPSAICYRAVPVPGDLRGAEALLNLVPLLEGRMPVAWWALRGGQGISNQVGRLADLSLTGA